MTEKNLQNEDIKFSIIILTNIAIIYGLISQYSSLYNILGVKGTLLLNLEHTLIISGITFFMLILAVMGAIVVIGILFFILIPILGSFIPVCNFAHLVASSNNRKEGWMKFFKKQTLYYIENLRKSKIIKYLTLILLGTLVIYYLGLSMNKMKENVRVEYYHNNQMNKGYLEYYNIDYFFIKDEEGVRVIPSKEVKSIIFKEINKLDN